MIMTDELQQPSEPDDLGTDHEVPADLVELHEVLEYELAVNAA